MHMIRILTAQRMQITIFLILTAYSHPSLSVNLSVCGLLCAMYRVRPSFPVLYPCLPLFRVRTCVCCGVLGMVWGLCWIGCVIVLVSQAHRCACPPGLRPLRGLAVDCRLSPADSLPAALPCTLPLSVCWQCAHQSGYKLRRYFSVCRAFLSPFPMFYRDIIFLD